jgi:2-polyprenyl-3-methyl-5-hydroxy-6-metoxy-1,4-benzoquinol methylase
MKYECLACGGDLGESLFLIPQLPLVDSFCSTSEEAKRVPTYSIDLRQCEKCQTIQVASPPDTSEIYRNYIYESRSSPDLELHFKEYAIFIKSLSIGADEDILEIGANDGLFLGKMSEAGFKNLLGIDPSPQTAKIQLPKVTIINDFFNSESTSSLKRSSFGLIVANNCFSHIPQLTSVISLCKEFLAKDGVLMVEVQSTLDLIENVVFDYIYHEHYFYHSATSFECVAGMASLELYDVRHVPTKGGSYRLLFGHPGEHKKNKSVDYWKYRESLAGIHTRRPWLMMVDYLNGIKVLLHEMLNKKDRHLSVYGASATGTVFLRYFELENLVDFIVDDNPIRQGLFSPGAAIPVLSPNQISKSDICLIAAWRHAKLIIPKILAAKRPYIIPLPVPTLYD